MMRKKDKYLLIIFCFFAIFCISQNVWALDVGLNYNEPSGLGAQDIRITIAKIVGASLSFLGLVFVVIIIIAGVYYFLNKQDTEKVEKAKKIIISAVIGLIIILSVYTIVNFIISNIIGEQQGGGSQNTNVNENVNVNENENGNTNENTNINGGLPTSYNCTGDLPYAILCEGTDLDLSGSTPKVLLPDCTYKQKCEYICEVGFNYLNGVCYGCVGENPANTVRCSFETNDIDTLIPKVAVASCHSNTKCEYRCKFNYILKDGFCEPNPFKCQGTFANAAICLGDNINLTNDTASILVKECGVQKCEYKCNSNFLLVDGICLPNTFKCLGDVIANSTLCPNSNIDLPSDLNNTATDLCQKSVKCQYQCQPNYSAIDNKCVPIQYATLTADNSYTLYVNEILIGSDGDWYKTETYNLNNNLKSGENIIAIKASDWSGGYGLIAKFGRGEQKFIATGDSGWKCLNLGKDIPSEPSNWLTLNFDDSAWSVPESPSPGRIASWSIINIPGAQWIWTSNGGVATTILCRFKLSLL